MKNLPVASPKPSMLLSVSTKSNRFYPLTHSITMYTHEVHYVTDHARNLHIYINKQASICIQQHPCLPMFIHLDNSDMLQLFHYLHLVVNSVSILQILSQVFIFDDFQCDIRLGSLIECKMDSRGMAGAQLFQDLISVVQSRVLLSLHNFRYHWNGDVG